MEVDNVFHPAHKLTYYEKAEKGSMVCAACVDEISTEEHYGCEECNFFLHKLCAQRPSELTHSLHPLHPLQLLHNTPYDSGNHYCDACGKQVTGFIYRCSICDFDLDFICAFPDGVRLNHFSHPEHVLTYEKSVKKGDKGMVCAACLDDISSQYYGCGECNFFLHKLCAQRPLELTHSLHPLHPLQLLHKSPYDNGKFLCLSCAKILGGFVYHCSICEFDLDFICAFPDGSKLNHIFHREHVLTYEKAVKRSDKGVVCAACLEEISGRSTEHYSCRPCNFFLHKLCAETPLQLTHSSHTLHPLQLIPYNPYDTVKITCDSCKVILNGFIYYCSICETFLHLSCAVPSLKPDYSSFPGGSKRNHISHPHILTFEKVPMRADKELVCAACLEDISADYYCCRKCYFFLHQLCVDRPQELTHSSHPQHKLHLLPQDPYERGTTSCSACHKTMKGFVYFCLHCGGFRLDFKCAFPRSEKRIQNLEQVHHHPLTFIPRPAKFSCDLCSSAGGDGDVEEQSYACSTCDFLIHKSCALTKLAQRYKHHQHPLSLVQGVPEDLQIYKDLECNVCHKIVSPEDLVPHCARCRYFVHVRCMITDDTDLISNIKDVVDYIEGSLIQLLLNGEEFVHWPQKDISSELIQPFLLGKNGIVVDVQPKIRHFSHEQHDMTLFQELCVNNDNFFKEEDEEILCDACIHPITAPYYCCQDCSYYLHSACANLPNKINHFSHSCELHLCEPMINFGFRRCNRCHEQTNGMVYGCKLCNFSLDLTCAALPAVIMHETHEHLLFEMEAEDEGKCYACHTYATNGDSIFKCRSCDVYISKMCVMYSRSIRYRWDREHPIDLKFPPHADHPDHFMCDMCEELIHPKHWLYSCFKCDVSFHQACAPRYQRYPNIKFGGNVKISFHPHILKFLMKATLKITCDM